jgi:hypothetical protein
MDENASITIPMYLLIIIIIFTIILGIFLIGVNNLQNNYHKNTIESTILNIINQAETMNTFSDEGTNKTFSVNFPDTLEKIVFGANPDDNLINSTNNNSIKSCYYIMNNGENKIFHTKIRFTSSILISPAIFQSGNQIIKIELIKHQGDSYIKINKIR